MDQARWDKIEAKRAEAARFRQLEKDAFLSQLEAKKPTKVKKRKGTPGVRITSSALGADMGINCKLCKRPLYRKGYEKPGPEFASYGSLGRCSTCTHREDYGKVPLKRAPSHCVSCGREFHNRYDKTAVRKPGTVVHSGKGRCSGCNNKKKREDDREEQLREGTRIS